MRSAAWREFGAASFRAVSLWPSQDARIDDDWSHSAHTISAKQTEKVLVGKPVDSTTLDTALDALAAEFDLPYTVPGGMPTYRRTLCMSFLFKFWVEVAQACDVVLDGVRKTDEDEVTNMIHRAPSSSTRDNSDPYAQNVVGKQVAHSSGLKHCTGEAIYSDDMPAWSNEGHLALVLSSRAHAKLPSVDPSDALDAPGVLTYVDWRDLPSEKANVWGPAAQDELFFAKDEVTSHGAIIGAVVAKTKLQAQRAARLVKVEYEDLPMILTIDEVRLPPFPPPPSSPPRSPASPPSLTSSSPFRVRY